MPEQMGSADTLSTMVPYLILNESFKYEVATTIRTQRQMNQSVYKKNYMSKVIDFI